MGSYRHLSRGDRDQIAGMRAAGLPQSRIAETIGKSKSTISRELRRNALDGGGYSAAIADGAYMERRQRPATLERDTKLATFVRQRLSEGWSPRHISGWLQSGAEAGLAAVTMETIHAFIYRSGQKTEELWRYLARRRKKHRAQRSRPTRDTIKGRTSIHERPDQVDQRTDLGHRE